MATAEADKVRFLRVRDVQQRLGVARSTIYLWVSQGIFPAPVKLGPRAVAWPESVIDQWASERAAA